MALINHYTCRFFSRTSMALSLLFLLISVHNAKGETCKLVGDRLCVWKCETSGRTFDLGSLQLAPEHPVFKGIPGTKDNATYSYDPCASFSDHDCKSVALCQHIIGGGYYSLGKHKDVVITSGKDSTYISYQDQPRKATVHLVCSSADYKFDAMGEISKDNYDFTLSTKYVCATGGGGLSVGSVLLIIFFVLLLIYVIGGILYLRFAHGARGVEQIPNYDFWLDFPVLVKDGIVFVSRGCKDEPTYEKI